MMNLRHISFVILLVLLIACAGGCFRNETTQAPRTLLDADTKQTILDTCFEEELPIVLEEPLKAGSFLIGCRRAFNNMANAPDFQRYELYIGAFDGKRGTWTSPVIPYVSVARTILNEYSFAFAWKSYNGTDLLFVVSPAGDTPLTYDVPYAESEWFNIVPYDSMGTEPIFLRDDEVTEGYPIWIFCTTVEDLEEDYELHYGDLVLTYDDLKDWLSNVDEYMPKE